MKSINRHSNKSADAIVDYELDITERTDPGLGPEFIDYDSEANEEISIGNISPPQPSSYQNVKNMFPTGQWLLSVACKRPYCELQSI